MPPNASDLQNCVRSFLAAGILPLSRSVSRVQGLLRSANYNAADLAEQMRTDPTLTARVMAVANSAFFSKSPCENITDAVNRLGTTQLTQIFGQVLATTAVASPLKRYQLSPENFWRRAVMTAVGAEFAAAREGDDRASAYLIGLLHEIGMILTNRQPSPTADMRPLRYLDFATEHSLDEKQLFHFHHADFGAELLNQLSFPESVCRLVRQQYRFPEEPLARALYLGRFAKATFCTVATPEPNLEIFDLCGLKSRRDVDAFLTAVNEEAQARIHGNRTGARAESSWR